MYSINENIYGHLKRLEWVRDNIKRGERVMEFGCGAGTMVTIPLIADGYDVIGLDRDERSIEYGRDVLRKYGFDPARLVCKDLNEMDEQFDVIIASEVFEHIRDPDLDSVLDLINRRLKPGGKLLVTVPNGFGWFELESFVFYRLGVGPFLVKVKGALRRLLGKAPPVPSAPASDEPASGAEGGSVVGGYVVCPYVSTFDSSPHVQRFTRGSLRARLSGHGYQPQDIAGTVLFAGPFSEIAFTGVAPVMTFNKWLGNRMPALASGYMVVAGKPRPDTDAAVGKAA